MSERSLLLGYDLGYEKTQLAVYNREMMEPELVGQTEDNPDALLDTAIAPQDSDELVTDFLPRVFRGEAIEVEGKISSPVNVLAFFFRKTLSLTRQKYPGQTIKQLVVTIADQTPKAVQMIYDALETLGIGRERARVINHKQGFLYYALYQKKELWVNDVGMFDYDGSQLRYYQMSVDRRKNPIMVGVKEKDFSDAIDVAGEDAARQVAMLENVIYGAIHKQILSTLYMTGEGFELEQTDELFKKLCVGRRLFKGRNLYVSGACYAAREFGENAKLSDYLLLDEDMISSHLSIQVYTEAKEQNIFLAKAGTPWYQVEQELDLIPEEENELRIAVRNVFTQEEKTFIMDLNPVSGKIDRRCRIRMQIRFRDVHTCIITMKDKGFGEIFPTSNRIWEKEIRID